MHSSHFPTLFHKDLQQQDELTSFGCSTQLNLHVTKGTEKPKSTSLFSCYVGKVFMKHWKYASFDSRTPISQRLTQILLSQACKTTWKEKLLHTFNYLKTRSMSLFSTGFAVFDNSIFSPAVVHLWRLLKVCNIITDLMWQLILMLAQSSCSHRNYDPPEPGKYLEICKPLLGPGPTLARSWKIRSSYSHPSFSPFPAYNFSWSRYGNLLWYARCANIFFCSSVLSSWFISYVNEVILWFL